MTRHTAHVCLAAMAVAVAFVYNVERSDAHKPITSPYSYNDDVFSILRDQCGRCHVSGGVAQLVARHVPPGDDSHRGPRRAHAAGHCR